MEHEIKIHLTVPGAELTAFLYFDRFGPKSVYTELFKFKTRFWTRVFFFALGPQTFMA